MSKTVLQTAPASNKGILDEKGLLGLLPISRRTLANWKARGLIPFIKVGRRCLYHWPTVEAALLRLQRGTGE